MERTPSLTSPHRRKAQPQDLSQPLPFTQTFTSPSNSGARKAYLKTLFGGSFLIVLAIFAIFSIYWGALWKTPVRNLGGWVVDFDSALIGQSVTQALTLPPPQIATQSKITWNSVPASQIPGGLQQLADEVINQKVWVAVAVHTNATARLLKSYASPNKAYDGSQAITVYTAEARNENAFRIIIRPSVQAQLTAFAQEFSLQALSRLLTNPISLTEPPPDISAILRNSPQTVLAPVGYKIENLIPFSQPVASAVTFVGMIFQLILSFFVVMIGYSARDISGINTRLTLCSLIIVRLVSAFGLYFFISFFYALLSLAFQLNFTSKSGHAGFVIFWMLNWVGMLSVGLALESLITLLTPNFIPFFLITWIIANVAVSILPIEVLPTVYRYGYAAPFYNISHGVRCILFGTKNTVGVNFAILIGWTAISCITLSFIQWFVRRRSEGSVEICGAVNGSIMIDTENVAVEPQEEMEEARGNVQLQNVTSIKEGQELESCVDKVKTSSVASKTVDVDIR